MGKTAELIQCHSYVSTQTLRASTNTRYGLAFVQRRENGRRRLDADTIYTYYQNAGVISGLCDVSVGWSADEYNLHDLQGSRGLNSDHVLQTHQRPGMRSFAWHDAAHEVEEKFGSGAGRTYTNVACPDGIVECGWEVAMDDFRCTLVCFPDPVG